MWNSGKYDKIKKIGTGTYGTTFIVSDIGGKNYCLKEYKYSTDRLGICQDFIRDIFHCSQVYSNVYVHDIDEKYVVFELYDMDLDTSPIIPINIHTTIYKQLYQLHSAGFIHSDIKPSNILIKNDKYSLCDFGLTEYYGFPCIKKTYISTEGYKHPNRYSRNNVSFDMYGLGKCFQNKYINEDRSILQLYSQCQKNDHSDLIDIFNYESNSSGVDFFCGPIFKYLGEDIYYNYYVNSYEQFEVELLEHMFNYYENNQITIKNENTYSKKIIILNEFDFNKTPLEVLFFAWNLVDNVKKPDIINEDTFAKSCLLFSKKFLEFSNLEFFGLSESEIIHTDIEILKMIANGDINFTPIPFYLYYYLFKIAKRYPHSYFTKWKDIEMVSLTFLTITFLTNTTDDSYNNIVKGIIIMSYNYLLGIKDENVDRILDIICKMDKSLVNRVVFYPQILDTLKIENK